MSTAKGYHDALLALSGNPVFAAARDTLLAGISDNELLDVITHGLKTGSPRETLNAIATRLLDGLATAARVSAEGKHGGDDGGDDDDSGGGGGRKSGRGAKPRKKTDEEGTPRRKRAQPQPAKTPVSQGTPSSTTNKKRPGPELAQPPRKKKDVSPEPMDDDEDFFKAENVEEHEVVKVPAKKVTKKPSRGAPATNSDTTASSSTAATADSDTVTSFEDWEMWQEIQKRSVIGDLQFVNSNDSDGKQADTRVPASRITQTTRIPDVDVRFQMPNMPLKKMNAFSLSFVKEFVRTFNKDYLVGEGNRTAFRNTIKRHLLYGPCVRCVVHSKKVPRCPYSALDTGDNKKYACDPCRREGKPCARVIGWLDSVTGPETGRIKLTVYPLHPNFQGGADWQTMGFWVGT